MSHPLQLKNTMRGPSRAPVCVLPDIPQAEMGAGSVATSRPRPNADRKLPYIKITRPESGSMYGCWMPLAAFSAADEFAGAEPGEQILLEFGLMTEAEYEALPEFEGW